MKVDFPLKAISSNQAYPTGRNGKRYLDCDGVTFKRSVTYLLVGKIPWRTGPDDRFVVNVKFRFKDKRRRDIDDYFKLLLDSFTDAGVWQDDCQIVILTGNKEQGCSENSIQVTVFRI